MDVAVKWGPFLILVEVKGCQFRLDVAHSDLGRLKTDLEKNVVDAFEQAQRAYRYITSVKTASFQEKQTTRVLRIAQNDLLRVFKLSVTLHHLADLTTQLANLKVISLFTSRDYPLSLSLGHLQIISQFCEGPDVFLHYIERRIELQKSEKYIAGDELDIFGMYLDTRLPASQLWERKLPKGSNFAYTLITGGAERFCRWKNAQIGLADAPEIFLRIPTGVKSLLTELRRSEDDSARWTAFCILSLSNTGMARLEKQLKDIHSQRLEIGQVRSNPFVDGNIVVVLTFGNGIAAEDLTRVLTTRVILEKYQHRLPTAMGFSFRSDGSTQVLHSTVWLEQTWVESPEMERLTREYSHYEIKPGQEKPGRNDPCVCGSGKKFKHCCLPFIKKNQAHQIDPFL